MTANTLFPGFTPFDIRTDAANNITIHGIKGGEGPPLLLIHGFPQTHAIWHAVAPQLTSYTVVAIDVRGYGASSKPAPTADHAPYSKTSMARDCIAVMKELGFADFFVCGHDRGARVAHQLAVTHPDAVRKLILLDICPTLAMYEQTDARFATAYWHWFFLIQPHPAPETILGGGDATRVREWLQMFTVGQKNPDGKGMAFFLPVAFEEYVQAAQSEDAVAAFCEDYRAAATVDCEEQRKDIEAGRKIKCDLRVLWGKKGVVGKMFEVLEEWRKVCEGEVSGGPVESGHYIPEEAPEEVLRNIKEFLV